MARITQEPFGSHEGREVRLFRLARATDLGEMSIGVIEYGAALVSCMVPSPSGEAVDIVLGHDTLERYVGGTTFFGAIAGRYGNRLRGAKVTIDAERFDLVPNEGANQLHGGPKGFDKLVWEGRPAKDGDGLVMRLVSPDGDMGFPGRLDLEVRFRILPEGGLAIDMIATSDRATVCNPVHHTYWNLGGHASGPVLDHVARFNAGFYVPVDGELLATGEILKVEGTPFDFRSPKPIGRDIDALSGGEGRAAYEGGGYDHNLVLGVAGAEGLRPCAEIVSPRTGLGMRLATSEPGVQFYTGGYLSAEVVGKGDVPYAPYGGFTLETQKFPCSPEFVHFPSPVFRPGETYRHAMRFGFFAARGDP